MLQPQSVWANGSRSYAQRAETQKLPYSGSLHESALSVRHLGRSMNGLRAGMSAAPLMTAPPVAAGVTSLKVESKMGAVAGGLWPSPRFPSHRVTGGGHPPPVPTERGVRISRTNALRKLVHSTASACSSEYGRRSLGGSNGVRSLIWLKASQVRRRPAQLRLHNIRRQ
jgi:hypothetical protein